MSTTTAGPAAEETFTPGASPTTMPVPQLDQLDEWLTLRDGAMVRVRAIRPDDTDRLRAFHASLSFQSIVFRFFRAVPELPQELAERFTHVDYQDRMALVATSQASGARGEEEIIAVVRYDRTGPHEAREAEVAFVVQDRWQGHGIATELLYRLAAYARERGITTFVALTMGSNQPMLDVFRYSGFPHTSRFQDGEVEVRLDITADAHTLFHTPAKGA